MKIAETNALNNSSTNTKGNDKNNNDDDDELLSEKENEERKKLYKKIKEQNEEFSDKITSLEKTLNEKETIITTSQTEIDDLKRQVERLSKETMTGAKGKVEQLKTLKKQIQDVEQESCHCRLNKFAPDLQLIGRRSSSCCLHTNETLMK